MLYLSHAHKPSATLQSLVLPDFLPSGPSLAVVYHSSIAFLALPGNSQCRQSACNASAVSPASSEKTLQQLTSVDINARILAVKAIGDGQQQQTKRLLVLTDHHQPRFVVLTHSLDPGQGDASILTEAALLLDEVARPPAELGLDLLVEPTTLAQVMGRAPQAIGQRYAATHTHSGLLRIVPIGEAGTSASAKKASSGKARRKSSAAASQMDIDAEETTTASRAGELGRPDTARAFGVRLPHPTLISSAFLHPQSDADMASLALLSLSSVPSRIPGLGQQCLPVLSFHGIDHALQELKPLAWGPPRKAPSSTAAAQPESSGKRSSSSAGASAPRDRRNSRGMPGSYAGLDDEDDAEGGDDDYAPGGRGKAAKGGTKAQSATKGKGRGPSAMGMHLDEAALHRREESWAKSPLARSHVPLPFTDALGAHLIHALPASVGGGVVVFSETSIILVPPPSSGSGAESVETRAAAASDAVAAPSSSDGASAVGKRRKGSNAGDGSQSRPASITGSSSGMPADISADVLATSPTTPSSRSNENGKRRRSSAALVTSPPTSPTATRAGAGARRTMRLLRTSLPCPVQVSAAVTVVEADGTEVIEDQDTNTGEATAHMHVVFARSSGDLEVLKIRLASSGAAASAAAAWRPVGLSVMHLGAISQATGPHALTYLGEGFVHVSSSTGDAVLYRIEPLADPAPAGDGNRDVEMITPPTSPSQSRAPPPGSASFSDAGGTAALPLAGRLVEIHRWDNLGPIVDFTIDDGSGGDPASASSAQARIVTCSGSGPTASLRVVKTGVAIEEVVELDGLAGASRVWTLHAGRGAERMTTMLAVGHSTGTSFLEFQPDGSTVDVTASVAGSVGGVHSSALTVTSIEGSAAEGLCTFFAVVDRQKVALLSSQAGRVGVVAQWTPEGAASSRGAAIVNAAANEHGQVVLCLADGHLVYLEASVVQPAIREVKRLKVEHEAACIDVSPFQASRPAAYCAVASWGSLSSQIYSLPDFKPVAQSSFAQERMPALPRSILLHSFGTVDGAQEQVAAPAGLHYILIGLGDGTLISHRLSLPDADSFSDTVGVYDRKVVSLGTRALRLDSVQTSEGLLAVSVAGERPSLIYADQKRLSFSAAKYKSVRSAATLYVGADQPALTAFAVSDGIKVSSVGALQKLDIRTIPLGVEQPLAIAQHRAARAFGVATWTFLPQASATSAGPGGLARGGVRLLDQADLALLDEIRLEAFERPNCIAAIELAGDKTYLVVGTGYVRPDVSETVKGRLIGYEVVDAGRGGGAAASMSAKERSLKLAFEEEVGGNVYAVVGVEGRLAAAINSRVAIYALSQKPASTGANGKGKARGGAGGLGKLSQTGEWGSAFVACTLSTAEPGRLVVGDALRSMNILEVNAERGSVSEVARDCDPFWTTATEMVDERTQTFIGADVGFNLYTTQRVELSDNEKRRMRKKRDAELESGRGAAGGGALGGRRGLEDGYAHVMRRQAAWHYGDMINKFQKGALSAASTRTTGGKADPLAPSAGIISPRLVFATAAGAIGVVSQLDERAGSALSQLERNILSVVESSRSFVPGGVEGGGSSTTTGIVGGIAYDEYRTLRTDHRVQPRAGVVDGEVIRLFTEGRLDSEAKRRVLEGPSSAAERIEDEDAVVRWCEELALLD